MPTNAKKKKSEQLGMNDSTASHKLRKLILFSLVQQTEQDVCYRCRTKIETVEDISIEHKMPWLDSSDPISVFFDLNNIAFSHLKCNIANRRKPNKKYFSDDALKAANQARWRNSKRKNYNSESRRVKYLRTGW
jgi:hypothetical protein